MKRLQPEYTELKTHTDVFLYFHLDDECLVCPGYADVCSCGADPTGESDSSAAFQKAITASQCVLIPKGKYKLSDAMCAKMRQPSAITPQAAVTNKLTL
jgi:hypothetical protein